MNDNITPEQLTKIALEVTTHKYIAIKKRLQKAAALGHNKVTITNLPEVVSLRLKEEGFSITTYVQYKYTLFLKRKKVKYFVIRFH